MGQFIGRENEIKQLRERFESQSPELVVVYGRRRVGKTFLIRQAFDNRFDFYLTGLYKKSMRRQLENFRLFGGRFRDAKGLVCRIQDAEELSSGNQPPWETRSIS